jgi:murein DD-endopeptidase MepM/ murein hydrolase activator NlpD
MTRKLKQVLAIATSIFWQTSGLFLTGFYLLYRFFIPYKPGSHPLSKFFRQVFEQKRAKTQWGLALLLVSLGAGFFVKSQNFRFETKEMVVLAAEKNVVTTESSWQKPTAGVLSQGYSYFHQAIDLAADLGEKVYPVATGKVSLVEYGTWGYGHFVVIDHENGYQSLYAHLGKITIQPGDEVKKDTVIGNIGLTGMTTGPHLHLEVYSPEGRQNPLDFIPNIFP